MGGPKEVKDVFCSANRCLRSAAPVVCLHLSPKVAMPIRMLIAAFALMLVPASGRASDDDNPYKNSKIGDFAIYKMTMKVAGQVLEGTMTQTVIEKSEKEVILQVTSKIGGRAFPEQRTKMDITKPFDPTKTNTLQVGVDAKVEKGKEGKEKLKVAGKEFDTVWTNYKVTGKAGDQDIESEMKVWMSKDLTGALARIEMKLTAGGMTVEATMELTEKGSKK